MSRVLCVPIEGDGDERGEKRAEQAADGRERVEPARHRARVAHVVDPSRIAKGATMPEQGHGRREEREHGEERAERGSRGDLIEPVDGHVQERAGSERHGRDQHRSGEDDAAEHTGLRAPVGQPAAEPVPDRERREHEPDHVRPHDRRAAVVGRDEARGPDLGRKRSGPGAEDERVQREQAPARPPVHSESFSHWFDG